MNNIIRKRIKRALSLCLSVSRIGSVSLFTNHLPFLPGDFHAYKEGVNLTMQGFPKLVWFFQSPFRGNRIGIEKCGRTVFIEIISAATMKE